MMLAMQLLRAYILWALLIGQGVWIALAFLYPSIFKALSAEMLFGIIGASGLVGMVGEWLWRNVVMRDAEE